MGTATKKALVYNPYFDTLGGGEKYTAAMIMALTKSGYQVDVPWHDQNLHIQLYQRFGYQLEFNIKPLKLMPVYKRLLALPTYNLIFWVSDGSIPLLFGQTNWLHFQVPFTRRLPLFERLKLKTIHRIICNSKFTQSVIKSTTHQPTHLLYPPTDTINSLPKNKTILSVGRFDNQLHNKRQDILIQAFKQLHKSGWRLILAGGCLHTKDNYLTDHIKNYPIDIITNPSHQTLTRLYGEASLYWHAAGYHINESIEPEKVEHFGIATVEAMSAGAVPLVYNAGGQKEIVSIRNGFLWNQIDELVNQTKLLIDNPKLYLNLSKAAKIKAKEFNFNNFFHKIQSWID